MNFVIRSVREGDLENLMDLARQFSLLNLPADKKIIQKKIELSEASFAGEVKKEKAEYIFVIEDTEGKWIAGSSQLFGKHGTEEKPTYSFQVLKKERFSKDLGVGFIHQILRLKITTDGPSELGGLVVDKSYRNRPEKIGKMISLSRFGYLALRPDLFQKQIYAQMAPPLTEEGRSEFWEALGRRFTGMPYQEADILSQQNQEFIRSLFPEEDIYLALLDAKARLVMGRVNEETRPALYMLESLGLEYMEEVDPFDGGPHYKCNVADVSIVKNSQKMKLGSVPQSEQVFTSEAMISFERDKEFICGWSPYSVEGDQLILPEKSINKLAIEKGQEVLVCEVPRRKEKDKA